MRRIVPWKSVQAEYRFMYSIPESTERLVTVAGDEEASVIVAVLRESGIAAVTQGVGEDLIGMKPINVRVLVPMDDLCRARDVLSQAEHEGHNIDWSQVDVGDSEQESEVQKPRANLLWRIAVLALAFAIAFGLIRSVLS